MAPDPQTIRVGLRTGRDEGQQTAEGIARNRLRRPAPGTTLTYIMDVELRADPVTGARCAYLFNVPGDPNGSVALQNELRALRLVGRHGVCSRSPLPAPTPSRPEAAAEQAWQDHIRLPDPQLHIAPGWALTGKRAFLEVGGPTTAGGTFTVFGYTVEITARPVALDVDWGDGIVERNLRTTPGPWPDGQVHHVYTDDRPVTVTVTRHWTGQWRIGSASGTIEEPLSTTATLALEVRQLQAVRNR